MSRYTVFDSFKRHLGVKSKPNTDTLRKIKKAAFAGFSEVDS